MNMVEINSDVKTMGIPINMQRVFNPLVEAATLRLQDSQIGNFNIAIENLNVSQRNDQTTRSQLAAHDVPITNFYRTISHSFPFLIRSYHSDCVCCRKRIANHHQITIHM